jgi:hypothetical protein
LNFTVVVGDALAIALNAGVLRLEFDEVPEHNMKETLVIFVVLPLTLPSNHVSI